MLNALRLIFWTTFGGACAAILGMAGLFLYLSPNLDSIKGLCETRLETPLQIYSADGKLIRVFGEKRRKPVRYDEVPPLFVKAILAAEDDRFLYHHGIDVSSLTRAALELIRSGEIQSGGSTITMQVAKNCLLSNERTFKRKFNEILLAINIERRLSKQEILETYFNVIFLGKRAHGIQAAAERYYGKPLDQLNLAQLAMIAGLPKAPSLNNPVVNPDRARSRRNWILSRMLHLNYITREMHEEARAQDISAAIHDFEEVELDADYFAEMVRGWMYEHYGESAYSDGYHVHTTLDARLQEFAIRATREGLLEYDRRHGYRGPEARLEPPPGNEAALSLVRSRDAVGGLLPALVTETGPERALVMTAGGPLALDLEAVRWARPYINENSVGAEPQAVNQVLQAGDLIRLRQTETGPELAQVPAIQGALTALDPDTGAILALTGGFDFKHSKFNRAVQGGRQPGSTFKPFIYTAALESGLTPASMFNDAPISEAFDAVSDNIYVLNNAGGQNRGPTLMREGLYRSVNTVSARVLQAVGIEQTLEFLQRIGFDTSGFPHNLQLAIGGGTIELSPLQLATGYAMLANGGYRVEPWFIDRVLSSTGEVVYQTPRLVACAPGCPQLHTVVAQESEPASNDAGAAIADKPAATIAATATAEQAMVQADTTVTDDARGDLPSVRPEAEAPPPVLAPAPLVMDPRAVFIINSMLRDVIMKGTGRAARSLGRSDIAGKTGTTNDAKNLWFSGFNRDLVATVWVGFDTELALGRREYGSTAALPVWKRFMARALEGRPERILRQPDGIETVRVSPQTGLRSNEADGYLEYFISGTAPGVATGSTTGERLTTQDGETLTPEQLF